MMIRSILGDYMSPTGMGIRNDAGGKGHWGARRKRINANGEEISYYHNGVDYKCIPGQAVFMPFTGQIIRIARPYVDDEKFSGAVISCKHMTVKIFYFEPYPEIIGKIIKIGLPIGRAQDISLKYPESGVTPHIHVQIEEVDPDLFFWRLIDQYETKGETV
jgi:hypothetical protein